MDALTQLIHSCQVFFPKRVENLQHNLLFKLAHVVPDHTRLGVVGRLNFLNNPVPQRLFMKPLIFFKPRLQGQRYRKLGFKLSFQSRYIPLFLDAHGGNETVNRSVNNVRSNLGNRFS